MTNLTPGEWLGDERRKRKLRQLDLAGLIGVTRSAVANWETDAQPPSEENADAIARVFGLDRQEVHARLGIGGGGERKGGVRQRNGDLTTGREVPVTIYSRIPADAVRWMQPEGDLGSVQVPIAWLRGRSLRDVFAVEVSGDCLLSLHIQHGDVLVCEWRRDRTPADGDLVVVRIEDEVTCKRWYWSGEWVELRDGDDVVTHRMRPSENVHVEGYVIARYSDYDRPHA